MTYPREPGTRSRYRARLAVTLSILTLTFVCTVHPPDVEAGLFKGWKKHVTTDTSKRAHGTPQSAHGRSGASKLLRNVAAVTAAGLFAVGNALAGGNVERLEQHLQLSLPDGAGPHPLVLMASGCNGFEMDGEHYTAAQNRLTKAGFAVARVDSLKAVNSDGCFEGFVNARDQVADIAAVAKLLKERPEIDGDNVSVVGWSWGGRAAIQTAQNGDGAHRAVAFYPTCQGVVGQAVTKPTLILRGGADDVVDPKLCKAVTEASGDDIRIVEYPDAHHLFDNPNFTKPTASLLGTFAHSPEAEKLAWQELQQFLSVQ